MRRRAVRSAAVRCVSGPRRRPSPAAGLPVITSRANGTSELIEDGREGFVLDDPTDPGAIAKAILAVGDPAVRGRMGQAARRRAEAHPFDAHLDQLLALIEVSSRA